MHPVLQGTTVVKGKECSQMKIIDLNKIRNIRKYTVA